MKGLEPKIAVAYLARSADQDALNSFKRFVHSYQRYPAGIEHKLYIIHKGFIDKVDLAMSKSVFAALPHQAVCLKDLNFDLGAYVEWANMIEDDFICVLNTASEILSANWLKKLTLILSRPYTGLVGASGSYESGVIPEYPNLHIRTNAFMIERKLFVEITKGIKLNCKRDVYELENGYQSLTRQVMAKDKQIFVVGKNGRAYAPAFWPRSNTFRQGKQDNILIADNQTRSYSRLIWPEKVAVCKSVWDKYLNINTILQT